MNTLGGYHEYIRGCSVHRRDIMIHVGEQLDKILSISIESPDVFSVKWGFSSCIMCVQYIGGYHEYIGGCSVHWGDTMSTSGMFSTSEGYHEYIGGIS